MSHLKHFLQIKNKKHSVKKLTKGAMYYVTIVYGLDQVNGAL